MAFRFRSIDCEIERLEFEKKKNFEKFLLDYNVNKIFDNIISDKEVTRSKKKLDKTLRKIEKLQEKKIIKKQIIDKEYQDLIRKQVEIKDYVSTLSKSYNI